MDNFFDDVAAMSPLFEFVTTFKYLSTGIHVTHTLVQHGMSAMTNRVASVMVMSTSARRLPQLRILTTTISV